MAYTDEQIERLIRCPKKVVEPPKREMKADGRFRRNDMTLQSDDFGGEFYVFVRQSEDFPENFSIGLRYDAKDGTGDLTLMRCNGQHGAYNGSADPTHPHWDFHVHRATQAAIESGHRPEKHAEKTTEYASFEEALRYFLTAANVDSTDIGKYFPAVHVQIHFDFVMGIQ